MTPIHLPQKPREAHPGSMCLKSPDWRWLEALAIYRSGRRLRRRDDRLVNQAVRYMRARVNAHTERERRWTCFYWPELSRAHDIYSDRGVLQDEIEARLLAGQPFGVISDQTRVSGCVLNLYEAVFFNVAAARLARDWVRTSVLDVDPDTPGYPTRGLIWKGIAWDFGSAALDLVIADERCRREPVVEQRALQAEMLRRWTRLHLLDLSASDYLRGLREFLELARQLPYSPDYPPELQDLAILEVSRDIERRERQLRRPSRPAPPGVGPGRYEFIAKIQRLRSSLEAEATEDNRGSGSNTVGAPADSAFPNWIARVIERGGRRRFRMKEVVDWRPGVRAMLESLPAARRAQPVPSTPAAPGQSAVSPSRPAGLAANPGQVGPEEQLLASARPIPRPTSRG